METKTMKIAAITEDGSTISQHFGRAPKYLVLTIEDGNIVGRELRDKLGHSQFHDEHGHDHQESQGRHGYGPAAEDRHARMSEAIADCEAILCGGMGRGAYESMRQRNIRPVVTDIQNIEEAAVAYATGRIVDHIEKLH
ncbi:MAG: NifB/NifX family molybdenum-iron cluster-binding protein [Anaerolineales bacterium]